MSELPVGDGRPRIPPNVQIPGTSLTHNDIRSTFDTLSNIRERVYEAQQGRSVTENLFDAMKDLNFLISVFEPSGWDG